VKGDLEIRKHGLYYWNQWIFAHDLNFISKHDEILMIKIIITDELNYLKEMLIGCTLKYQIQIIMYFFRRKFRDNLLGIYFIDGCGDIQSFVRKNLIILRKPSLIYIVR